MMNVIKWIGCNIKAIPLFIKCGVWTPHVYTEGTREDAIIITTNNGFRVAKDFIHTQRETVHPNAKLIKSNCIYCGKKEMSWCENDKAR